MPTGEQLSLKRLPFWAKVYGVGVRVQGLGFRV